MERRAERDEFELSGDFLNGQSAIKKRKEVLKRLAARSLRRPGLPVVSHLLLARLCIYENGTVSSKLLRSANLTSRNRSIWVFGLCVGDVVAGIRSPGQR